MVQQDKQVQKPSPFLEILCKSSGKIRRFGKGTEAQFALKLINQKLGGGDDGAPLATYIEAVKDGEEPVSFGPTCVLIDYGDGWRLQTATNEDFEKKNGVESALEKFPTDAASGKNNDAEQMSEQFPADKERLERANGVELTMEQFPTCEETSFEQETGFEPMLEQSSTHKAFEKENDVEHAMEQFSTAEVCEQENGVEPVMEQYPIDEADLDLENCAEPALEPLPMDEDFEKENNLQPTLEKFPTDEELETGNSVDSTLEKFPDVTVSPLPNTKPLSMIHVNNASDGEEGKNRSVDDSGGVCIDMTDIFTTTEIFPGKDELVDWCRKIGMSVGVMIIIGRSDSSKNKRRARVVLNCERCGVNIQKKTTGANSNKRTRELRPRKCNCPFRLKGIPRDEFEGGWELKVECGTHNHPLKENLIGHPYIERLTPEEEAVVSDLSKAGVKPQEMLDILKKMNPNNLPTKYTIYNYRARNTLSKLHCRSNRKVDGDDG